MKIVILAAGAGKRFRSLDLPKPLTRLDNGESILKLQIDALSQYHLLDEIIIVVGYRKEKVIEQFPNLLFVYNPSFAEENTAKSLLRALNKVDDDVLWLNGDVVFQPEILKKILNLKKNGMIVNASSVGDEEVKYRTNKQGKIIEISKQVSQPEGEALGINFFTKKDLPVLKMNLSICAEMDYFEKAIELSISEGISVWPIHVGPLQCAEVDFPEDLKKANQVISNL